MNDEARKGASFWLHRFVTAGVLGRGRGSQVETERRANGVLMPYN
jgi:hypothetical protein